jgi:phage terminase large subunit GpA-like protein
VLYLTCGVDVQDDRLEYEIVGWRAIKRNETEESWGLENSVLYGEPAQLNVWTELDAVTGKPATAPEPRFGQPRGGRKIRMRVGR